VGELSRSVVMIDVVGPTGGGVSELPAGREGSQSVPCRLGVKVPGDPWVVPRAHPRGDVVEVHLTLSRRSNF
jgi:hypothetical protein